MKTFLLGILTPWLCVIYQVGDGLGYENQPLLTIILALSTYFGYTTLVKTIRRAHLISHFKSGVLSDPFTNNLVKDKLLRLRGLYNQREERNNNIMYKLYNIATEVVIVLFLMLYVNFLIGLFVLALIVFRKYVTKELKKHLDIYAENH